MHRVYCEQIPASAGQACQIEGDEAHHAVRVKRVREGERVELFDGAGVVAEAVIERVVAAKRSSAIEVRVGSVETRPPERPAVHVLAPAPKGGALEQMIDQLSQVGAASWALLRTERSEREPRSLERLRRAAIEAAKQCGRAHLLDIRPAIDLGDALRVGGRVVVADASGVGCPAIEGGEASVLIGPEGGWSDAERDRIADAGASVARFGPHVMRIETAAVAAVVAMLM